MAGCVTSRSHLWAAAPTILAAGPRAVIDTQVAGQTRNANAQWKIASAVTVSTMWRSVPAMPTTVPAAMTGYPESRGDGGVHGPTISTSPARLIFKAAAFAR